MEERVGQILKQFIPSWKELHFLVAVSGGVDSMVLLSILQKIGVNVAVAHVNYQLRGEDSQLDEQLVKQFCNSLDIPFFSKKVDLKKYCKGHKMGIQEGAREVRYAFFQKVLARNNCQYILTAHHLNDNTETFFLNLMRGAGIKGLKSIQVLEGELFRPLLSMKKENLIRYALDNNVPFREDASNTKNGYSRNELRNEIFPLIEKYFPHFQESANRSIENLQRDNLYLQQHFESLFKEIVKEEKGRFVVTNFRVKHPRFIQYVMGEFGFSFEQFNDLMKARQTGKQVGNRNYIALINRSNLIIHPSQEQINTSVVVSNCGIFNLPNGKRIEVTLSDVPKSLTTPSNMAYFDEKSLSFPFVFRPWKNGDKILPLGMKGSKKISDILIDNKVSQVDKMDQWVVAKKDRIHWLLLYNQSDLSKIKKTTRKVLKMVIKN